MLNLCLQGVTVPLANRFQTHTHKVQLSFAVSQDFLSLM